MEVVLNISGVLSILPQMNVSLLLLSTCVFHELRASMCDREPLLSDRACSLWMNWSLRRLAGSTIVSCKVALAGARKHVLECIDMLAKKIVSVDQELLTPI